MDGMTSDRAEYFQDRWKKYACKKKRVSFVLESDTYAALEARAESCGQTVPEFLRESTKALLSSKKGEGGDHHARAGELEELRKLVFLVRNIANNINQVVRHSHVLGYVVDDNALLTGLRDAEVLIVEYFRERR